MTREDIIALVSEIDDIRDIHKFAEDDELDHALSYVVKFIKNPDLPASKAVPALIQLQAISVALSLKAKWYATEKKDKVGTVNHTKKELYYTASDKLDRLVDALKFAARNY